MLCLPQLCRTEIVRVVRLRVAVAARGERPLTLAVPADLACSTETVRVSRGGVAVAALGQTPTLDTLRPGTAGGVGLICCRVTVAPGGEGRLTGAVLQDHTNSLNILTSHLQIIIKTIQFIGEIVTYALKSHHPKALLEVRTL